MNDRQKIISAKLRDGDWDLVMDYVNRLGVSNTQLFFGKLLVEAVETRLAALTDDEVPAQIKLRVMALDAERHIERGHMVRQIISVYGDDDTQMQRLGSVTDELGINLREALDRHAELSPDVIEVLQRANVGTKLGRAMIWLSELFMSRSEPRTIKRNEVMEMAALSDFSQSTINRARKELDCIDATKGVGGFSYWTWENNPDTIEGLQLLH